MCRERMLRECMLGERMLGEWGTMALVVLGIALALLV